VPTAVDASSGYRYYSPGQLHEARVIDNLRRAKVPLAEIATFLIAPTVEQFERWEGQIENDASQRRAALAAARELLVLDEPQDATTGDLHDQGGMDMISIAAGSATETGGREQNEDAVYADGSLAAVADGLGGHPAGQVASNTAIEVLRRTFTGRSIDELESAVRAANGAVWERAADDTTLEGMGTTLCAVGTIDGSALGVINVGDSRAYLFRKGTITQLTADHNVVSEMIARGELSEAEAADHEYRHVLTRALGVGPTCDADALLLSPQEGDRLLLCTDGLVNELTDDQISAVLVAGDDPARTARRLVEEAISGGANDNVSAVVIDVPRGD
jgi:protein phosphatase